MELEFKATQNGQEIQTGDVNAMSEAGALADDRVLAELLRLAPNTGTMAKCIVPYGVDADTKGTVAPSGLGDANVVIRPFRAVVGSRDAASTNAMHAWRDIRSGVCVAGKDVTAATPPTSLTTTQAIAANSSGHARWDVLYAIVTPDTGANSVPRFVKSATSGAVTAPSIATLYACKVSLGYAQGAPSTSPQLPSVPVDTTTTFYIALAYVMVPNGFGASSTVQPWMILGAAGAPHGLSKGLGGATAAPANQQNVSGGQVVTSTSVASWANNSDTVSISARPNTFMPPGMIGMETVWCAFDLSGTTPSAWSHQSLSLVDNSRDWRNRLFRVFWTAALDTASNGHFAWDRGASAVLFCPRPPVTAGTIATGNYFYYDMGQSFIADGNQLPGSPPASSSIVSAVGHSQITLVDSGVTGSIAALYVNQSDGTLRLYLNSTGVDCKLIAWVEATRPYPNY